MALKENQLQILAIRSAFYAGGFIGLLVGAMLTGAVAYAMGGF